MANYTSVDKPTAHFNTVLYTGNSSTQAITGVGFQPDLIWNKCRATSEGHNIWDAIRGTTKGLVITTSGESTWSTGVTAFDSDGWTMGSLDSCNSNGNTFVAWCWKAGGAGSANTDGSINSTVSANTEAGISMVKYTGTASNGTVGHGLGAAPTLVIVKRYSTSGAGWMVQCTDAMAAADITKLNDRTGGSADSANFNGTAATSSVFSVGTSNNTNASGTDLMAYCFAPKRGFSRWGRYTGAGSDRQFVYTGFRPAMVMMFNLAGQAYDKQINDNRRSSSGGGNVLDYQLEPNTSDVEASSGTSRDLDFYSTGFKFRGDGSEINANGVDYMYIAFGDMSVVSSNNVPGLAR